MSQVSSFRSQDFQEIWKFSEHLEFSNKKLSSKTVIKIVEVVEVVWVVEVVEAVEVVEVVEVSRVASYI